MGSHAPEKSHSSGLTNMSQHTPPQTEPYDLREGHIMTPANEHMVRQPHTTADTHRRLLTVTPSKRPTSPATHSPRPALGHTQRQTVTRFHVQATHVHSCTHQPRPGAGGSKVGGSGPSLLPILLPEFPYLVPPAHQPRLGAGLTEEIHQGHLGILAPLGAAAQRGWAWGVPGLTATVCVCGGGGSGQVGSARGSRGGAWAGPAGLGAPLPSALPTAALVTWSASPWPSWAPPRQRLEAAWDPCP